MARDWFEIGASKGMLQSDPNTPSVLSSSAGKHLLAKGQEDSIVHNPRLSETGYHCVQYYSTNLETLYRYLRLQNPVVTINGGGRLLIVLGHGRHQKYGLFADSKKKISKSAVANMILEAADTATVAMDAAGPIGLAVFLVCYPAALLIQKGIDRKSKFKWWVRVVLCSQIHEFSWDDSVAAFKSPRFGGKEAHLREMTEALTIDKVKHHSTMTAAGVASMGFDEEFEEY